MHGLAEFRICRAMLIILERDQQHHFCMCSSTLFANSAQETLLKRVSDSGIFGLVFHLHS